MWKEPAATPCVLGSWPTRSPGRHATNRTRERRLLPGTTRRPEGVTTTDTPAKPPLACRAASDTRHVVPRQAWRAPYLDDLKLSQNSAAPRSTIDRDQRALFNAFLENLCFPDFLLDPSGNSAVISAFALMDPKQNTADVRTTDYCPGLCRFATLRGELLSS